MGNEDVFKRLFWTRIRAIERKGQTISDSLAGLLVEFQEGSVSDLSAIEKFPCESKQPVLFPMPDRMVFSDG